MHHKHKHHVHAQAQDDEFAIDEIDAARIEGKKIDKARADQKKASAFEKRFVDHMNPWTGTAHFSDGHREF